jgi:hypothetical protein
MTDFSHLRECNQAHRGMSVDEMTALVRQAPPGPWPHKKDGRGVDVWDDCWAHWAVTKQVFRGLMQEYLDAGVPAYPDRYEGCGIVIAAGGPKYIPSGWVAVKKLRHLGCILPIQVWHLGSQEMDPYLSRLFADLGADTIDARIVERSHPARVLCGWELKGYAAAFCPFREVLFLDADCVPIKDPSFLFDCPEYQQHGAIFWPDFDHSNVMGRMKPPLCEDLGIRWQDEPSFESGQFLIHKERCWPELMLTWWILQHSDYYFVHVYGDKETFHIAWRRLETDYFMPAAGPGWECRHTILQHTPDGSRLFQHRVQDKWKLGGGNRRCPSLEDEDMHHAFVRELRDLWPGQLWHNPLPTEVEKQAMAGLAGRRFLYERLPQEGFAGDARVVEFLSNGRIGEGSAECERRWVVHEIEGVLTLTLCREDWPTCHLTLTGDAWEGQWLAHERCHVRLSPAPEATPAESGSDGSEKAVSRRLAALLAERGHFLPEADVDFVAAELARSDP